MRRRGRRPTQKPVNADRSTSLRLRWIDACPSGTHRPQLVSLLAGLPIELRQQNVQLDDDDALIALDPPAPPDAPINELIRTFRQSRRPVATLRPVASTRPADLLIVTFDGLLAQLPDGYDSSLLDEVLITLLRQESANDRQRYEVWLRRALFNAALARLDAGQSHHACRLLSQAMDIGPVPDELDRTDREGVAEALAWTTEHDGEEYEYRRRLQAWLLT